MGEDCNFKLYYRTPSDSELKPLSEGLGTITWDKEPSETQWVSDNVHSYEWGIETKASRELLKTFRKLCREMTYVVSTRRLPRKDKKLFKKLLKKNTGFKKIIFRYDGSNQCDNEN